MHMMTVCLKYRDILHLSNLFCRAHTHAVFMRVTVGWREKTALLEVRVAVETKLKELGAAVERIICWTKKKHSLLLLFFSCTSYALSVFMAQGWSNLHRSTHEWRSAARKVHPADSVFKVPAVLVKA